MENRASAKRALGDVRSTLTTVMASVGFRAHEWQEMAGSVSSRASLTADLDPPGLQVDGQILGAASYSHCRPGAAMDAPPSKQPFAMQRALPIPNIGEIVNPLISNIVDRDAMLYVITQYFASFRRATSR